jgi:hypothetical protein
MLLYLKDVFNFIRFPVYNLKIETTFFDKVKRFSVVFAISILFTILINICILLLAKIGILVGSPNLLKEFSGALSVWQILLSFCIIAPIIEELTFRLQLRVNTLYFSIFAALQAWFWLNTFSDIPIMYSIVPAIVIFLITFYLTRSKEIEEKLSNIWKKYFRFIFYITAFTFGLAHTFNQLLSLNIIAFAWMFTLYASVIGIWLGYIRIRNGIIWSMVLHSSINLFFVSIQLLFFFGTSNYSNANKTVQLTAPTGWTQYYKSDIDDKKIKPFSKHLEYESFDYIIQENHSGNLPEIPFVISSHNVLKQNDKSKILNEIIKYPGIVTSDSNWLSLLNESRRGKMFFDSKNQRLLSMFNYSLNPDLHLDINIKTDENILDLKVMYILEREIINVDFVVNEKDFNKCKKDFNEMLLSAKVGLPKKDYLKHLLHKKNVSGLSNTIRTPLSWREFIGFLVWGLIIYGFIQMFINDKNRTPVENPTTEEK